MIVGRALVVAGLVFALGACAQKTKWSREGVGDAQFVQDRAYCRRGAGGYDFLGAGGAGALGNADLFAKCMQGFGYTRVPAS